MHILFVCRAFDNMAGGVERMAITLINDMVKRGNKIPLLTWDYGEPAPFYKIDKSVKWFRLNLTDPAQKATWKVRIQRLLRIRRFIKKMEPQVIIGFQSGAYQAVRIASLATGIPVIAAERNSLSRLQFTSEGEHSFFLFASLYFAAAITVQFEKYINTYPFYLQKKIVAIENPVFINNSQQSQSNNLRTTKIILSVGRLSYQKNYESLLKAFAELAVDFPYWKLLIAGEGEEREALTKLLTELNITDRVSLLGAVNDVNKLYCKADLFCLPSRWEGFPNSLAEALACGVPAVGYANCDGVNNLIEDNKTGLLAAGNGNVATLRESLRTLMQNNSLISTFGANAKISVHKYNPKKSFDKWENLFKKFDV